MPSTLDIILITYNQSAYVRRAMHSIEEQVVTDDYSTRVVIADDSSTDGTRAILQHWNDTSHLDTLMLPELPNGGITWNYRRAFEACNAEYIAILEGDDYWCCGDHIKRHIDFLQQHPGYVISANRHIKLYENAGILIPHQHNTTQHDVVYDPALALTTYHHDDQCTENRLGNLSSVVLRGSALRRIDPSVYDFDVPYLDDWTLGIELSQYGDIAVHDAQTTVYRVHDSSTWAGENGDKQHQMLMQHIAAYKMHYGTELFAEAERRINSRYIPDKHKQRLRRMPQWLRHIYRLLFVHPHKQ